MQIDTVRLTLRPFALGDLDDLHAWQSRGDVARYLYWQPRSWAEALVALHRKIEQTYLIADGDQITLAIHLPNAPGTRSGVIGEVNLLLNSAEHRQGELGYVLHPDHHGHGFASEAASAMLDLAFNQLALHRVFARADDRNRPSIALMHRLGMREEAHFIQNEWFKGEWGSEVIHAILQEEWHSR